MESSTYGQTEFVGFVGGLSSSWTSRTGHRAVLFVAIGVLPAFFQKNSSSVQGLSSPFDRNLAPDREGNNAPRGGGEKC